MKRDVKLENYTIPAGLSLTAPPVLAFALMLPRVRRALAALALAASPSSR
jgi:hypothetical protein